MIKTANTLLTETEVAEIAARAASVNSKFESIVLMTPEERDALCRTIQVLRAEIVTSDQEWQSRLAEVERERDRILKLYNEAWLWVQQRVKHPNSGLPPAAMTLIEMLPLLNQRVPLNSARLKQMAGGREAGKKTRR